MRIEREKLLSAAPSHEGKAGRAVHPIPPSQRGGGGQPS
jgi:hypothetical protein